MPKKNLPRQSRDRFSIRFRNPYGWGVSVALCEHAPLEAGQAALLPGQVAAGVAVAPPLVEVAELVPDILQQPRCAPPPFSEVAALVPLILQQPGVAAVHSPCFLFFLPFSPPPTSVFVLEVETSAAVARVPNNKAPVSVIAKNKFLFIMVTGKCVRYLFQT